MYRRMHRAVRFFLSATLLGLLLIGCAALAGPGDKAVRLTGNLADDAPARVSPRQLEAALPVIETRLYNPWEKRTDLYQGVLIDRLVDRFGGKGVRSLHLRAIDDYQVDLSREMWNRQRILLVTRVNGRFLPVRDKGPLRIVFPDYDPAKKEYELNLPLWMWMIREIEFR